MLSKEDNLYVDLKSNSNVILSSSSTAPSANTNCSTTSAVPEQPHGRKIIKSAKQIHEKILEKLRIAYQNLCPIINEIISNSTECTKLDMQTLEYGGCMCSVTHEQYIGAIKASELIQEVHDDAIQSAKFNLELAKGNVMHLPPVDFIVNSAQHLMYTKTEDSLPGTSIPRIYIEQKVVNQLVELYNLLHGALQQLSEITKEEQTHVNLTNKVLSKNRSGVFNSLNTPKNQLKLPHSSSTDNPENSKLLTKLQEEYQGLSDAVDILKSIIKETSGSINDIIKFGKNLKDARNTKSDNSIEEIAKSKKITDVTGARRCILECLVELAEVRKYLKNLDNTKEPNVVSQIYLTADLKRECCSKRNIPHLHAKLNGIPIVVKLNQETFDTMLSFVGSHLPHNVNEDRQTGIVRSSQKYKCITSKCSPSIKSRQSTKLISSDDKELSSKPREEYECKQKCSTKLERELSLKKLECHNENENKKKLLKPKMQLNVSQSVTTINKKIIQSLNKSCKSLDSALNKQQSITKRTRISTSNQVEPNKRLTPKQCVNQGDFLAKQLSTQTFFDNQTMLEEKSKCVSGKTSEKLKAATITKISEDTKKKSKQLAKRSKRKSSCFTYNVKRRNTGKLLQMGCYTKRRYYTGKHPKNALYQQVVSINNDTILNVKKENDIINRTYGTCSTENVKVVCYESERKLYNDKSEQKSAIISTDVIENDVIQITNNFEKLFKISTEQHEIKSGNQAHVNIMTKENNINATKFTSDNEQEIAKFSETFPLQTANNEYNKSYNLTFTNKTKEKTNKLSGSSSNNNVNIVFEESGTSNMLRTIGNKQQLSDDFSKNYTDNVHKENDSLGKLFTSSTKQQDNVKLLNNSSKNNEENFSLSDSFMDKVKQQIIKLADRISPKNTDSVPEEINNSNALIINEIKQKETIKLFNAYLAKNSSKLQQESDCSTIPITVLASNERKIDKINRNLAISDINTSPDRNYELSNSFTDKTKEESNNLLPKNKLPKEINIPNKPQFKQNETIKFSDGFLIGNVDNNNKNKRLTFATQQQETLESDFAVKDATNIHNRSNPSDSVTTNTSVKKDMRCNTQNSLSLNKTLEYKSLTLAKNRNSSHENSFIINLNAKPNHELNNTSQLRNITELKINKNAQSCSGSKTTSTFIVHEKNNNESVTINSDSVLNIPYVVSVKSIPKIKMEEVRPNLKCTTKNTVPQNYEIYHSNTGIKRQLEEIEASSPAKCCGKAISNEKSQLELPYQVSLMSLPSDAIGTNAINKLTTKRNIKRQYDNFPNTYYSKLNYYSNLETGFERTHKETYEVRYFELKKNFESEDNTTEKNKSSTKKEETQPISSPYDSKIESKSFDSTSKYIPPWGQSFEVRILEYERDGSDTDLPMAMSKKLATSTAQQRTSKSRYYSYPDEEDYIINARRKSTGVRRPDEELPRMMNRRQVEKRTDSAAIAPHGHGESRLGLEQWAPFVISDISLPTTSSNKNKKADNPFYQGKNPEASSLRSEKFPLQNLSNPNREVSPRSNEPKITKTYQDGGVAPIILTPELLEYLTRGNQTKMPTRDAAVNPILRNMNFERNTDEFPYKPSMLPININKPQCTNRHNLKCCSLKTCTVSTDTDDIDFQFPQKHPKVMIGKSTSQCPQKRSFCLQCDLANIPSEKANYNKFTEKQSSSSKHTCSKTNMLAQPGTSKNNHKCQVKHNARNNDTRKETCKCDVSKDICLCDYLNGSSKRAGGTKVHSNNYKNDNSEINSNWDKTFKTSTDSKAYQNRKGKVESSRCYIHNPHVMYYLSEQRKKVSKTESNCSNNKLPISLEHTVPVKNKCNSTNGNTIHNFNQQSITEQNSKPQKSIIHQENIVQYCSKPQSNTMKVPFQQELNHPMMDFPKDKITDKKQQYDSHKKQIDKYYLLRLPNELSSSSENIFYHNNISACFPHSELIGQNHNSAEHQQVPNVVLKHKNKQYGNNNQCERIACMLKSYLHTNGNSNRKQQKIVESHKKLSGSSESVEKLSSEKYNDLTVYLYSTKPKLDKNKCLTNQPNQSSLVRPTEEREILKHIQYRSIGIHSDLVNESVSEEFSLNKSYSDVCNLPDYTEPSITNSNNVHVTLNMPVIQRNYNISNLDNSVRNSPCVDEAFSKGWTQHPSMLLKPFGTVIANTATEVATNANKATEEYQLTNKRSAKTVKNENYQNIINLKERCSNILYSTKTFIYDCSSQIITSTKEIPSSDETSKCRITSRLTDASTCTEKFPIASSTRCLKDVANKDNLFICKKKYHYSKHFTDMDIEGGYYDSKQLPNYSSKATQSPPVVYRSKLSDLIKKIIPEHQFLKNFSIKSKRKTDNFNLINHQPNDPEENESERGNFTETAVKNVSKSLQTDYQTVYNSKNRESVLCKQSCSLVNEQTSSVTKNIQKITNDVFHLINNTTQNSASVQYFDESQQTDEIFFTNNNDTSSRQLSSKADGKDNTCSVNKKQLLLEADISNNSISDASKTTLARKSSDRVITKPAVPLDSSNSKTYTEVYRSRLFACDSWSSLPVPLEHKRNTSDPNLFWIPPDYDKHEFILYASDSRLSNCLSCRDNNDFNSSRQSSHTFDRKEGESTSIIDEDNTSADDLSNINSYNIKDSSTYSFARLREECQKARIIPVALAMSQQKCQEVPSRPIIPVLLAASQNECQKSSFSPPVVLNSNEMHSSVDFLFHQTNVCVSQSTINNRKVDACPSTVFQKKSCVKNVNNADADASYSRNSEKSVSTQKESIIKQLSNNYQNGNQCSCPSKTSNCYEQQMLEKIDVELDKNQDNTAVYWALTKVKTRRDGSQEFEVLETTPIPPGHFLVPNANSVVLVGNRPYTSNENKEVN